MVKVLELFLSNRLEILYQQLKCSLFEFSLQPLMRRIVVVYGPAMKNWLILRMAQDPELNVAMGIEFIYLNQAFDCLLRLSSGENPAHIPTLLELALAIEAELYLLMQRYQDLDEDEQRDWEPILHHLKIKQSQIESASLLSSKMEKRLISLSQHIACLFQDYGRYALKMIEQWEKNNLSGWQPRLWRRLFSDKKDWKWSCHARELQKDIVPAQVFTVNIFSISFISAWEFDFLNRLSKHVSVNYFLLSPCAVFWSDVCSDREKVYLETYWQKKLGFDSSQVFKLEELLRDRNPLLANFGRIGREMACQIEESFAQTNAIYSLPQNVQTLDEELFLHEDLHLTESQPPLSLLHALQADLLMMRNPQNQPSIDLEDNGSLQLHIAPCIRREVEILYHNLLSLMLKDPALCPSDIIVMTPHIEEYIPYIQSIFGSDQSQLDFQILDLGMQKQSEIVQGFLQLLGMGEGSWDASQLLQFFGNASFQRCHQLSKNDVSIINEWVELSGIRWGDDCLHRNVLLERRHCRQGMAEETMIGTWDYGMSRLILGLATVSEMNPDSQTAILPCSKVDFSNGDLLGKWMRILHALRDDLSLLQDKSRLTMGDWAEYLNCLLECYFKPDYENHQSMIEYEDLKEQFEILRNSTLFFKDTLFPFISVKSHLLSLLENRKIIDREDHLQAVRFCSLMPLRSIPAKAVILLGMQDDAFPRVKIPSALNLMSGQKDADYCPLSVDFDRYLFLEALHSAKDYLLFSYQGFSRQDNKEKKPSLVVEELFSYLDKFYTIRGKKITQNCVFKHPLEGFDRGYFNQDSQLCNFSHRDFHAAQIARNSGKCKPHRFINDFVSIKHPQSAVIPSNTQINLKHIIAAVSNPIKFHFNRGLEIFLQTEEDRALKTEEELIVSPLDQYFMKQFALKEPVETILSRAEKEGKLPFGLFKTVANNRFKKEVESLHKNFQKHFLDSKDIFEIEFCADCNIPIRLEDRWLVPAISLSYEDGYQVSIIGKLPYVTSKGLVALSKDSFSDIWKMWPQFLLYCSAIKLIPEEFDDQLILTYAAKPKKAFFNNPEPYLKQLISYYAQCLQNFSPLMPDWIQPILTEDAETLQEKMRSLFAKSFGSYQNPYLKWIFNEQHLPDSEDIILHWKEQAEILAGDIMKFWFEKKPPKEVFKD